jgi:CBS domain-containing protein
MKAKDVMTSPVVTVESDMDVLQAVRIMLQRRVSGLPVSTRTVAWSGS